mgnify:FL=1
MKIYTESNRLVYREILPTDEHSLFELDSNALVHKYLGNTPVKHIEEIRKVIQSIRLQYNDHGIGRWAAIEKNTGNFIGWSGLKFITDYENNHTRFYDVGYRILPQYWGKGFATEAAMAALDYGFNKLDLSEIIGMVHEENVASRKVLEKCGLKFIEKFMWEDICCDWMKITRSEWNMAHV